MPNRDAEVINRLFNLQHIRTTRKANVAGDPKHHAVGHHWQPHPSKAAGPGFAADGLDNWWALPLLFFWPPNLGPSALFSVYKRPLVAESLIEDKDQRGGFPHSPIHADYRQEPI
jgi:hypothetical protein